MGLLLSRLGTHRSIKQKETSSLESVFILFQWKFIDTFSSCQDSLGCQIKLMKLNQHYLKWIRRKEKMPDSITHSIASDDSPCVRVCLCARWGLRAWCKMSFYSRYSGHQSLKCPPCEIWYRNFKLSLLQKNIYDTHFPCRTKGKNHRIARARGIHIYIWIFSFKCCFFYHLHFGKASFVSLSFFPKSDS